MNPVLLGNHKCFAADERYVVHAGTSLNGILQEIAEIQIFLLFDCSQWYLLQIPGAVGMDGNQLPSPLL